MGLRERPCRKHVVRIQALHYIRLTSFLASAEDVHLTPPSSPRPLSEEKNIYTFIYISQTTNGPSNLLLTSVGALIGCRLFVSRQKKNPVYPKRYGTRRHRCVRVISYLRVEVLLYRMILLTANQRQEIAFVCKLATASGKRQDQRSVGKCWLCRSLLSPSPYLSQPFCRILLHCTARTSHGYFMRQPLEGDASIPCSLPSLR